MNTEAHTQAQVAGEPRNEKRLTELEHHKRKSRIIRNMGLGAIVSAALGLGNEVYQLNRSPPPAPKGYSTLVDAQTTLSSLIDREHSLKDSTLMLNTPYRTEATNKALEGFPDANNLSKIVNAISVVRNDIAEMNLQNPEFGVYETVKSNFESNKRNYAFGGALGLFFGGTIASLAFGAVRTHRLGSTNFSYDLNGERIMEEQK